MQIIETPIKDLYIIEPKVFEDSRGYFYESYNKAGFEKNGINITFNQDNQSKSSYGVIRGLHYQNNPHAQTKLIRAIEGVIYDVAVDIRKNSPSYGKWFGVELSAENKKQLLIPHGFAHGFSVLSETAAVMYKCDNFYAPDAEGGIIYNDPTLNINWKIPKDKAIVSDKDMLLPTIKNCNSQF